jgi:capsular polysaccharide transport system permease protein
MYSLRRFLMSPDALRELEKSYGFRDRFRAPNGDMFLRLDATSDNDATLLYYQNRIDVRTSATENIITLNVQAFDPKVAHDMTEHLLVISENFINRMNNRALEDQVAFREAQVAQARDRLRRAQEAVTNWRHNNGVVDPGSQGKLIEGVISGLEVELSRVRADLEQLSTPDNVIQFQPRIKVLHEREAALKAQIEQNRSQLAGRAHSTVTNQLADYESLQADVQYAGKNLEMTMATAESARQDALQQHKYLIRISGPTLPSDRSFPLPGFHTLLTLVATLMLFGIAVLVHSIIRDYRSV